MAFESLTERLQGVFKNLRRKGKLSEKEVQEVTKEIRLALLEADVALPVVKTFIKRVRERAVGHEIIDTLDASQQIIKIVNEELTDILGSETSEIEKSPKIPTIIMMVGLQGAGKTTFAGKLANKLIKEQEARPMMIAADIYEQLDITGVVLTKIDGDTRGGAALSIREITGKPIKFTGTGEKITDIETFHPDRMSSRILGMGDLLTLIEKASQEYDEKKSLELAEKMRENTFDFNDFIDQLDQVQNMGPMEDLLKMLPGMANNPALANVKVDEKQIARKRAIVSSMTPEERENPDLLTPSRRRRIANGSGNTFIEVNKFIKDFNQAKQMMQGVMSGDMEQMMRQMGLNPNNLPKNMPNMPDMGNMDMSALEGMMGVAGMPDLGNMDLSQMLGGGLKGKVGSFAMKHAMKRQANKMKKAKKKRK